MSAAAKHGVHASNARLSAVDYWKLGASGAAWVKLLGLEGHTRADAEAAQAAGLKVLVRAPGEGYVDSRHVKAIFDDLSGVMDALELGNEPGPNAQHGEFMSALWNHAWYLEQAIKVARPLAVTAGCLLVAPGWRGECLPPEEGTLLRGWEGGPADYVVDRELAERLGAVYRSCDRIGVHSYSPWTLATTGERDRILRWRAWGWRKVWLTEYGIAGGMEDADKVARYTTFLAMLAAMPDVEAAFVFILGGVDFDAPPMSYHLTPAGWALLGQAVAALG
jgi:hypothetical protein